MTGSHIELTITISSKEGIEDFLKTLDTIKEDIETGSESDSVGATNFNYQWKIETFE